MKKRSKKYSSTPRLSLAAGALSTSLLLVGSPLWALPEHIYPSGETVLTDSNSFATNAIITGGTLVISGSAGSLSTPGIEVQQGVFAVRDGGSVVTENTTLADRLTITSGANFQSGITELTSGTLTISGSNSEANVGFTKSTAEILVSDGGKLTTNVGYLNYGDNNKIRVTGTGSLWHSGGQIYIGKLTDGSDTTFGSGSIILSDGGHLQVGTAPNLIALLLTGTSRSTLYIGGGADEAATKGGTVQAVVVSGMSENAGGAVVFNHTHGTTPELADPYYFSTRINNKIEVTQLAGDTVLVGNHDYNDGTYVYGGSLTIQDSIIGDSTVYGGQFIISGSTSGSILVDGGTAIINGDVAGNIDAQSGLVGGSGFIHGNLTNAAVVNPGNSAGVLTVGGNFTQTSSGTLIIEFEGTKHDKLVISGTAFLDGKLQLQGAPLKGKSTKLEILTADGGVEGQFSTVSSGLIGLNVQYLPNSVILGVEVTTLSEFAKMRGLTPNELAVAKSLDKAARRGKLTNLLGQLYAMSLDDVETALTLLSPEQISQIFQIGFSGAQTQFTNLERRLSDVRDGAVGFSTNGLALSNSRGSINYDGMPIMNERDGLTLAGWDGKSLVGKQATAPIIEQSRWSFFATGSGEWADVETTSNAQGSEFTSGGVTVGADYRVSDNFVVGIAGGYSNTQSDLANSGKIDVNSGRGSVYASVFGDGFYANTVLGGAYNSYKTKRGTLGGKADGDTNGGEFDALIGGGYDYRVGGFSVGPVASLQYTYLGLSSFQETGSSAPQQFSSQNQDSLKSGLGLRASYAWNVGGLVIKPEVRAQWQHEFLDSTASVESSFVGGAGVFTVSGPNIGRDSLLLDAGLAVQINPALSVFAYYTGEMGRTNYSSNAVNGGFRISF